MAFNQTIRFLPLDYSARIEYTKQIMDHKKPLIVQGDNTLLLEVDHPLFETVRSDITPFTELEKSPEHIYTFKLSQLSLWNAASAGLNSEEICDTLKKHSRYPVPENILFMIRDNLSRYGKLVLHSADKADELILKISTPEILAEIKARKGLQKYLNPHPEGFSINIMDRGTVKYELIKLGFPVKDLAPLKDGEKLSFNFRETTLTGFNFKIRDYQSEATAAFVGNRKPGSGFGTIVLPCGAGKTIVGMSIMEKLETHTLILTTNIAAVHQWREELLDKTSLTADEIGEYSGEKKLIAPVTIATYQVLVWRESKQAPYKHFDIFKNHNWGLIIYDEVHLLPAPVFRVTAELQAIRRLGLTATLVREDNQEGAVFSLVGPKRYDVPWKEMESRGWIAEAVCYEIRLPFPDHLKLEYATANRRLKHRLAAENPEKLKIVMQLVQNHKQDFILVIGQYLDQLNKIAKALNCPLITGKTPNKKREEIYKRFKQGQERVIVVSKVANFAIDLPDASMAIQVSGTFGSRQEEAQRLGRILRPKKQNAYFYSVITQYTVEEEFSTNRQKFLTEQGYKYHIEVWDEG